MKRVLGDIWPVLHDPFVELVAIAALACRERAWLLPERAELVVWVDNN
jgi:hypothetical protein